MIAIRKIGYNNMTTQSFNEFKLICDVSFDGEEGETTVYLSREAVASETYQGKFKRIHNMKYTEVFAPKVTLMKDDFSDFTQSEQRKILSWLTSKSTASMIDFYEDNTNAVSFSILGAPTEIQAYKSGSNRVIGYTVVFEGVHPWALSPLQTKTVTIPQVSYDSTKETQWTFTVNCDTDEEEEWIYPKVTITEGSSVIVPAPYAMGSSKKDEHIEGTVYKYGSLYYWLDGTSEHFAQSTPPSNWTTTSVKIENLSISPTTKTEVKKNVVGEKIILDGTNKVVSSTSNRIFGDNFNWEWFPLKKGTNTIRIIGNCTVTFEWREPRKIGELYEIDDSERCV